MKISIVSIGKFENSPHKPVFENYLKRLKWKVSLQELDVKNSKNYAVEQLKNEEGKLILNALKPSSVLIALDENGQQFSSKNFAALIEKFALQGNSALTFAIGGSDGLSTEVLTKSSLKISLGKMTFPHLMARSMLIEQLYRASTIISGHPYHRE